MRLRPGHDVSVRTVRLRRRHHLRQLAQPTPATRRCFAQLRDRGYALAEVEHLVLADDTADDTADQDGVQGDQPVVLRECVDLDEQGAPDGEEAGGARV
ncbi:MULTISPECIES: hypothetical protein [unclassified Pseudonocardia]|uniref:hypothetical protein n=1 Tax=unclassified Pseudonocardia TaxID=2619320 RepID=UPI0001FFE9C2|nr:hypothetical protein [Pseudonocardia sp. Ae707_Ps1]OLM09040.1 hypothetical protein Ae707Ps1_5987 [Pseudonocardia sp. Ae707_Ps1]